MVSIVSVQQSNPSVLMITENMSDMASMMMVDGVLSDQVKIDSMLATVNNTVEVAKDVPVSQEKLDVLEVSIDTISRLASMGTVDKISVASSIASVVNSADNDPKLMTATVKCIDAQITDIESVTALNESGLIDVVKNALVTSAGNPKLASAAKKSMAHLSRVAIDAEASIEPATMAKILDAQAEDEDGLVLVVDELADLGAMSLLECISTNPSSEFKVEAAATKSIVRATNNGAVEVTSITQGQMSGIVSTCNALSWLKAKKRIMSPSSVQDRVQRLVGTLRLLC